MKIKFDLNGNPPTQNEIDALKQELVVSIKKIKMVSYIIGLPCIVVGFLLGLPGNPSFGAFITPIFGVIMMTYVAVATSNIEDVEYLGFNNLGEVENLSEIKPDYAKTLLILCEKYTELEAYRLKVIQTGRKLTNGEFKMMRRWVEENQKKELLHKLHTPTVVSNK